jgi:hypothetical protein
LARVVADTAQGHGDDAMVALAGGSEARHQIDHVLKVCTWLSSSAAAFSAVTATGVFCSEVERLVAVTYTSVMAVLFLFSDSLLGSRCVGLHGRAGHQGEDGQLDRGQTSASRTAVRGRS